MSSSQIILIVLCSLQFCSKACNAQVGNDESTDCNGMGNCSEYATCIREYVELESYIFSNKVVLNRIVEAFFVTGKAPSNFVKITYDYQVSNSTTDLMDDNNLNCTKHQEVYFWSSSPLYLLGPKGLMFSTIFAVLVAEENVTITLPCLCKDAIGTLLSRLTYLIKTYAVHDQVQSMKHFSQFFVQTKAGRSDLQHEGGDNHKIVSAILAAIALIPSFSSLIFVILAPFYIRPKVYSLAKMLYNGKNHANISEPRFDQIFYLYIHSRKFTIAFLPALLIFSIGSCLLLVAVYTLSVMKQFEYASEYYRDTCDYESYRCHVNLAIPTVHAVCSALPLSIYIIAPPIWPIVKFCQGKIDKNEFVIRLTVSSLVTNIIIIGIYFAPYMLLAFITDPLQTSLIYCIGTLFLAVIFLNILGMFALCYSEFGRYFIYLTIGASMALGYFFTVIILVLTLGTINNFQVTQTIIFTLILGMITYVVLEPLYKQMRKKITEERS